MGIPFEMIKRSHTPPPSASRRKQPRLVRATEPTYQRLVAVSEALKCTLGEAAEHGLDALERELGRTFRAIKDT